MKNFILVGVVLMTFQGYSQTSTKTQPYSAANLNQYLWSFSKNSSKPGEKALVDFDAINNWRVLEGSSLGYLAVNNDGKYFAYIINKHTGTRYWFSRVDSLVVQSTTSNWRRAFAASQKGIFSDDGKQYIFQKGNALSFLRLGTDGSKNIKDVNSYKASGTNNWLAYQIKGNDSLLVHNLATGREKSFASITDYNFDNSGEYLFCKNNRRELLIYNLVRGTEERFSDVVDYKFSGNGESVAVKTTTSLQYINLATGDAKTINSTKEKTVITSYRLDNAGQQIVFSIIDSGDVAKSGLWYYATGMEKAVLKLNNGMKEIPSRQVMNDAAVFTENGKYIQFSLQDAAVSAKANEDMAGVEVWSSKDISLQSRQANQLNRVGNYNAIINIESGNIVFEESSSKRLVQLNGDFALVKKDYREEEGDRFWESRKFIDSSWIISLKDGSSHLLPVKGEGNIWFSPDGNWLVYFDAANGCHYFSYNLRTGELKNISATVTDKQLGINGGGEDEQASATGNLAAWIDGEADVLVYGSYDIWKLDVTGKQSAVNITNGFGQTTSTVLSLFNTDRYSYDARPVLKANEALVLRAFNRRTKQNGFYKKANLNAGTPTELCMGGYFMNQIVGNQDPNLSNEGMTPMKAKNNDVWIVQRQSTTDAPNYYATSDFKNFKRITNYQPQKNYQWYSQELVTFKHLDGKEGKGVLYKPENFNPNKRYPVLIAFYGQFSNNMYQFREPDYIDQSMATGKSPAWFLSNGFLVFTPDIAVRPSKYGPKAYSVIEGAAQYLKTLPYVDGDKLGIASHSWGGKLAAYLLTHSKSIAATAITEGFLYGNMINVALSADEDGKSQLGDIENGDYQFGNFWDNKDRWLDHTTVLNVDKSASPLLLLCNKESSPEYQDQTLQFFIAMRRLNKKAWWLKYDNGEHTLHDLKERRDYTIRYTQFFDHYLKNAPAPLWMTQGIPYKLKGIESRYELDPQGTCNAPNGEPCAICTAWNTQFKRTPEMFAKPVVEWNLDRDISDELQHKQNERRKQLDKEGEMQTKEVMRMLNSK